MERLTIRNSDGTVSQPTGTTVEEVFYRLAAYEDTGVEPNEVEDYKNNHIAYMAREGMFIARSDLERWIKMGKDRMNEVCKAEEEGRLVVLPCKVGQTVYKISHYHDCVDNLYETCDLFAYDEGACSRCYRDKLVPHIREVSFELSMLDQLGDTIFSTHEEAEALTTNAADTNVGNKGGSDG